jgi:hypothetical protein
LSSKTFALLHAIRRTALTTFSLKPFTFHTNARTDG